MTKTTMDLLRATGVVWGLATLYETDRASIAAAAQTFRAYAVLHRDTGLLDEVVWLESLLEPAGAGPITLDSVGQQRAERLAKRFRPDWDHIVGSLTVLRR